MTDDAAICEAVKRLLATLPLEEQVQVLQHLLASAAEEATALQLKRESGVRAPAAQPKKLIDHQLSDITYRIIGCAMAVHRQLGGGLREVSYQRGLELQLEREGLTYLPQQKIAIYDDLQSWHLLGYYIPDFVVEDAVVVEIKALRALDDAHLAQVISYLAVTECGVGLLINFGERTLKWRRILPPHNLQAYRVNKQWLWNPFIRRAAEQQG